MRNGYALCTEPGLARITAQLASMSARTGSRLVFLTRLGGGAFGNDPAWIDAAMAHALDRIRDLALDVRVVSRRASAGRS